LVVRRTPLCAQREERPRVESRQKTIHVCQPGDAIEYRDARGVHNGAVAGRKRELDGLTNSEVLEWIERFAGPRRKHESIAMGRKKIRDAGGRRVDQLTMDAGV